MESIKKTGPLVLLLNDDDDELLDLYSFLDREGYLVATRIQPLDACKYACERKPEIIVVGGRLAAPQCRAIGQQIQAVSPESRLLVVRSEDDSFALSDLAADPHVTVFREFSRNDYFWEKMGEILRRISRPISLSA